MTTRWKVELDAWNGVRDKQRFVKATGRDNPEMSSVKEMLAYLYAYVGGADKVAELFGVTGPPVRSEMHRLGLPLTKGYNNRKSVLSGVRLAGKTAKEIAKKFSITECTVRAYARKHGIKLRRLRK